MFVMKDSIQKERNVKHVLPLEAKIIAIQQQEQRRSVSMDGILLKENVINVKFQWEDVIYVPTEKNVIHARKDTSRMTKEHVQVVHPNRIVQHAQ